MGVGICLGAQLVQTNNKQFKSEIILQCYHSHFTLHYITLHFLTWSK